MKIDSLPLATRNSQFASPGAGRVDGPVEVDTQGGCGSPPRPTAFVQTHTGLIAVELVVVSQQPALPFQRKMQSGPLLHPGATLPAQPTQLGRVGFVQQ